MSQIGKDVDYAAEVLKGGGLVVVPTETVYGLAANALNTRAVTKIFEVKNRPHFDPLIIHVASISALKNWVEDLPFWAEKLLKTFSPGPLTLLLRKKKEIPEIVSSGLETIGVRIPSHPIIQALLAKIDFPLAAPSANLFGRTSPTRVQHAQKYLGDEVEYYLDGGLCKIGLESTILDATTFPPILLRHGGLPQEEIEKAIGCHITAQLSSSKPQAPGMLMAHYSPGKTLLLSDYDGFIERPLLGKKVFFLGYDKFHPHISLERQLLLTETKSITEAAANLFVHLNSISGLDVDEVWAVEAPNDGLGKAINDRLRRASFSIY